MKKRLWKLSILLLALLLSGCAPQGEAQAPENEIAGLYYISEIQVFGEGALQHSDIEALGFADNSYLDLRADNSATIGLYGQEIEAVLDLQEALMTDEDGNEMNFSHAGDSITLEQYGQAVVFTLEGSEDWAEIEARAGTMDQLAGELEGLVSDIAGELELALDELGNEFIGLFE